MRINEVRAVLLFAAVMTCMCNNSDIVENSL